MQRVLGCRGEEALGQCFEYQICFSLDQSTDVDFDIGCVIGEPAQLSMQSRQGMLEISGYVAEAEQLETGRVALYRVLLVPPVWFLRHSTHSRVFVGKSVPDTIRDLFNQNELSVGDYEFRLGRDYPPREHICQYEESDLAFLERWLEREGIYYFFEHGQNGSKLVLCDDSSILTSSAHAPIPYHPILETDSSASEAFRVFRATAAMQASCVQTRDYNYLTPDIALSADVSAPTDLVTADSLWAENEPDAARLRTVAMLRSEQRQSARDTYWASGTPLGVQAGFQFSVERHPSAALNREYLAVRLTRCWQSLAQRADGLPIFSTAEQQRLRLEPYRVDVEAIASDQQYRPRRRRPWPRAWGLELAWIDGDAASDYAQLDAHGRYLIRLMMDEREPAAGNGSMRVRQLQPHGGNPEGWHLPLRKGTEVLVAFVSGDPDRPVLAGAVPNALTPSPVTDSNCTKNVIQTAGLSRLEIEDLAGQQYVDVSTPPEQTFIHLGAHAGLGDHNLVLSTDGDGLIHTGSNRDISVGGDQSEDVHGTLIEKYHANQSTHVAAALRETVERGASQTIYAGLTQTVTGGSVQTIDGGETRTVAGGTTETIDGPRTQTIRGSSTESISASQTQSITGGAVINTSGFYAVKANGDIRFTTSGSATMVASSNWTMLAPGGQRNVDEFLCQIAGMDVRKYNVMCQPSVVNLTAAAIALGAAAVRLDVFSRKAELALIVIQNRGFKMESGVKRGVTFGVSFMLGFITFL